MRLDECLDFVQRSLLGLSLQYFALPSCFPPMIPSLNTLLTSFSNTSDDKSGNSLTQATMWSGRLKKRFSFLVITAIRNYWRAILLMLRHADSHWSIYYLYSPFRKSRLLGSMFLFLPLSSRLEWGIAPEGGTCIGHSEWSSTPNADFGFKPLEKENSCPGMIKWQRSRLQTVRWTVQSILRVLWWLQGKRSDLRSEGWHLSDSGEYEELHQPPKLQCQRT